MGSPYSSRVSRPIGLNDKAMGGAGLNMGLEAVMGETEMITTFDDFNGVVLVEGFGDVAYLTTMGWIGTDDPVGAPTGDQISMNDPVAATNTLPFDSCLRIFAGTVNDRGGNLQLDAVNGAVAAATAIQSFPHIWIGETATLPALSALDQMTYVFACRVGLRCDLTVTGAGAWESKLFIGWAPAGDASIMDHDTGVITIASAGPLIGFHIPEAGAIDGISHRTAATAMAEGTNFTRILAAGGVDGTVANGAETAGDTMWFDLALRMDITDMSDDDANGYTTFYTRGPLNKSAQTAPGRNVNPQPNRGYQPWVRHSTVLANQTPNHTVALVPTIEFINGPTADTDGVVFVDWWAMGRSRQSRR